MDFNVAVRKFIDMILDSILYLNFEKLPLVEFWCSYQRLSIIIWSLLKYSTHFFIYFNQNNTLQIECKSKNKNSSIFH